MAWTVPVAMRFGVDPHTFRRTRSPTPARRAVTSITDLGGQYVVVAVYIYRAER